MKEFAVEHWLCGGSIRYHARLGHPCAGHDSRHRDWDRVMRYSSNLLTEPCLIAFGALVSYDILELTLT